MIPSKYNFSRLFERLPEPARSRAARNMQYHGTHKTGLSAYPSCFETAIVEAFVWSKTPEGYQYWKGVNDQYLVDIERSPII